MTYPHVTDRAFVLLSMRRFDDAPLRVSIPDGVFVKDFGASFGDGYNWNADVTLFDPSFTAMETILGLVQIGGKARIRFGWVSGSVQLGVYDRTIEATVTGFRGPRITQDGAELEIRCRGIGARLVDELATADAQQVFGTEDPQRWAHPTLPDIVHALARHYGLETTNDDGVSTIEPTINGPEANEDGDFVTSPFRSANETILSFLRRIARYARSSRYSDEEGNFRVFIAPDGGKNTLYFMTRRYALDSNLVAIPRKVYRLFRGHASNQLNPLTNSDILDFDPEDDSATNAFLGAFGATALGTDPETGDQVEIEAEEVTPDHPLVGAALQSNQYRKGIVRLSSGLFPDAAQSLVAQRRSLAKYPLKATVRVLGIPDIELLDTIKIEAFDRENNPHWYTGMYQVLGFSHEISEAGVFETSMRVVRDGYGEGTSRTGKQGLFENVRGRILQTVEDFQRVAKLRQPVPQVGRPVIEVVEDTVEEAPDPEARGRESEFGNQGAIELLRNPTGGHLMVRYMDALAAGARRRLSSGTVEREAEEVEE